MRARKAAGEVRLVRPQPVRAANAIASTRSAQQVLVCVVAGCHRRGYLCTITFYVMRCSRLCVG